MDALFSAVLTSSLYAGIVGIVILILKKVLKDRINPKWHYLLWIVLILKLIIPFGPESVISLFNALPKTVHETDLTRQYEEFHKSMNTIRQEKPHVPTTMMAKEVSLSVGAKAEKSAPFLWCFGAAVMMGWLLYTNLSFYKRLKRNRRPVPDSIMDIFEECKKRASVKRDIGITLQDAVSTPAIFGVFKPTILLPSKIMEFNDKDISYIILHELSHYKRKDLFANYLLLLLQTIHWFNPVIWYCFKKVRQDMELAADEMVLIKLDTKEHREYGKAILTVLENFSVVRFAPRLVGMVDERENIKRRIRMIKMVEIFKSKKRIAVITVTLCIIALGAVLLTSAMPKAKKKEVNPNPPVTSNVINDYGARRLIKLKTPYVGNNSAVVRIIDNLPLANMRREVSLKTDAKPYGLTVKYDMGPTSLSIEAIENTFSNNAALLFALIGNADTVSFNTASDGGEKEYKYARSEVQKNLVKDIKEYAKDEASLNMLINGFGLKLYVYPGKYSPTMSNTPGIRIRPAHLDGGVGVEYTCLEGGLSTWDVLTGKITQYGGKVRLPYDTPVYWSPLSGGKISENISVDIAVLKGSDEIVEKRINIKTKDSFNFMVDTSQDVLIEDSSKDDISDASKVVTQYFDAFSKADYKTMCSMATEYHNKELVHSGDVWGMIRAKASEIKYSGQENGMLRFFVSVDMETAKTSAQYPSKQTSFYVELIKGADGNWKINSYTTG